ncbi:MAG: DUF559 domain-containing protein, partial [Chloroflexi bacterium]|nr:DUF559 domain-containing protein [Chloroflexota bacterium]
IELDGSQHLEQKEYDTERTKYLEAQGYKVIRFWNNEVLNNLAGVILAIIYALEENTKPAPSALRAPSPNATGKRRIWGRKQRGVLMKIKILHPAVWSCPSPDFVPRPLRGAIGGG